MIHEYVSYILCLYMNMCLLFVCMHMCDLAAHTYDHDTDDRYGQLLVALYVVDIWGRPSSEVCRRTIVETGIQWVERTLENSNDCFDMFLMRRCRCFDPGGPWTDE
jgi:hypothetical protein